MYNYIQNSNHNIKIGEEIILKQDQIVEAINFSNNAIKTLSDATSEFEINIFEALGLRNLSSIVGEYFVKSVEKFSNTCLINNPHQDGYPDLLLVNSKEKLDYLKTLVTVDNGKYYPIGKDIFSPFKFGGVEVKATCGNTPPAREIPKPLIGESRIEIMTSFEWKAHHRETNNLLSILWDFINEIPVIVACFYRNDLGLNDWGNIVQPREGGGRTTSVSVMKSAGVKKMCDGWVAVIDDDVYINKLAASKWIGKKVK